MAKKTGVAGSDKKAAGATARKASQDETAAVEVVSEARQDFGAWKRPEAERSNGKGTKGGRTKGDARPGAEVRRAERIAEAMDYRVQGYTYRQIADAMKISPSTAYDYVRRGLKGIVEESAEELLGVFKVQCQTIMQQLMPMLVDGAPTDIIQNILKVQNQWMRLAGMGGGLTVDLAASGSEESHERYLLRIKADAPVLRPDGPVPPRPVL